MLLTNNDPSLRSQQLTVAQTLAPAQAPTPPPTFPNEFCGVSDPAQRCTAMMYRNGFEQGLCGS